MIRPAKHLNLNTCVLRAASRLLAKLQAERLCGFEPKDCVSHCDSVTQ